MIHRALASAGMRVVCATIAVPPIDKLMFISHHFQFVWDVFTHVQHFENPPTFPRRAFDRSHAVPQVGVCPASISSRNYARPRSRLEWMSSRVIRFPASARSPPCALTPSPRASLVCFPTVPRFRYCILIPAPIARGNNGRSLSHTVLMCVCATCGLAGGERRRRRRR
jgi:hypothetical protein